MKRKHPGGGCWPRMRGFSLVELIVAIVIISVGAALAMRGFMQPAQSIEYDDEVQTVTQTVQACAEHVLHLRGIQANGWDNVPAASPSGLCANIFSLAPGYTFSLGIAAIATNPPCLPAAAGLACRQVTITGGKTGGKVAAVTYRFTLFNY